MPVLLIDEEIRISLWREGMTWEELANLVFGEEYVAAFEEERRGYIRREKK